MRCAKCQKIYDAAVEGVLSESLQAKVREHLDSCPACTLVWQENKALRSMLCEGARPARMPDAAYFARLARNAMARAEAEASASATLAEAKPGFFTSLGVLLARLRSGSIRLAQATALVAIGVVAGLVLSRGLRGFLPERPSPSGYAVVRETTPARTVFTVPPSIEQTLPANLLLPGGGSIDGEKTADHGPITKLGVEPTPPVDPAVFVAAWQKTVTLLDKMTPSEEVERLRTIQRVSRQIQSSAVLARLQDLKLQLVRTGQTDYIADVHRIEEVFQQLAAASRESQAQDFAHLETYQKAEEALIEKRYDDAMRLFKTVVIQAPGSYLAARATYQMGNIGFEHFRDFKNALIDYNQCLSEFPQHFVSGTIQNQIHERVELIAQNSVDNYAPLQAFYKAESTSKPAAAIPLYCALLKQYPQSPLVKSAIEAMTRIVRQAADDTSTANQVLEALDQFQDQNPGHPFEMNAQLGLADVTNYCVRNRQQAVLEYTKILDKAKDPDVVNTARERLRLLEKQR